MSNISEYETDVKELQEYLSVSDNRIKICEELNDKYYNIFEEKIILTDINDKTPYHIIYNLKYTSNYLIKCLIESFINKNINNENNTNNNEFINISMLSLLSQYITNKNIKELKEYKNEYESKFKEIFDDIIAIKNRIIIIMKILMKK